MRNQEKGGLLLLAAWCAGLGTGCPTLSVVRPADNLAKHEMEMTGGLAANNSGIVEPVAQVTYGVEDWLEVCAHVEYLSGFVSGRFGLLSSERDGWALAIGAGVGLSRLGGPAVVGDVTTGRRFDRFELYFGSRTFWFAPHAVVETTLKAGGRYTWPRHLFLGIEAGPTYVGIVVAEAAVVGGLSFDLH